MSRFAPLIVFVGLLCGLYSSSLTDALKTTLRYVGQFEPRDRNQPVAALPVSTFGNLKAGNSSPVIHLEDDFPDQNGLSVAWTHRGVNEYGLCFDWIAPETANAEETTKSLSTTANPLPGLSGRVLQSCRSVDEAIDFYLSNYKELAGDGFAVMVDRHGDKAMVHWENGHVILEKSSSCRRMCEEVDSQHVQ